MIGARLLEHVRQAASHLEQAAAAVPQVLPAELDEAAAEDHDETVGHFDPHDEGEDE